MFRYSYLYLIALMLCVATDHVYAKEVKLTTYYPSPNGNYDTLTTKKLLVTSSAVSDRSCDLDSNNQPIQQGQLVYDDTGNVFVCTDTQFESELAYWKSTALSGNSLLYPSTNTTKIGYFSFNNISGNFAGFSLSGANLNILNGSTSSTPLLSISTNSVSMPSSSAIFTTAGNVGVGISTAQYTLDVASTSVSTARFTGSHASGTLVDIKGQGNTDIGLRFYKRDNTTGWTMGQLSANNNFIISQGVNLPSSLSSPAPVVISHSNGFVGINQAVPTDRLHVNGSTTITQNLTVGGSATIAGKTTMSGDTSIRGALTFEENEGELRIPVYTGTKTPSCWNEPGCLWINE